MIDKKSNLPIYVSNKSRSQSKLNEKHVIVILIFASILSFIVILTNLPQNESVFLPRVQPKFYHSNEKDHELHHLMQLPIEFNMKKIDDSETKLEKIRQVAQQKFKHFCLISQNKFKINSKMTMYAWESYKNSSLVKSEFKKSIVIGHPPELLESKTSHVGLTVLNSLDSFYLMGLYNEFEYGKEWIFNNSNISSVI